MKNGGITIVLIEDDYMQRDWLQNELEREFDTTITAYTSESEFVEAAPELARLRPDVFVVDIMLPWNNTDNLVEGQALTEAPADRSDILTSGIRIKRDIECSPELQNGAVILYSVLDRSDLPPDTRFLPKESSIGPLAREIRARVRR